MSHRQGCRPFNALATTLRRGRTTARYGTTPFRGRGVHGTGQGEDNPQVGPVTVIFVGENWLCRVPSTRARRARIWVTFPIVLRAPPRSWRRFLRSIHEYRTCEDLFFVICRMLSCRMSFLRRHLHAPPWRYCIVAGNFQDVN
jgi:hypothetical protein